MPKLINILIISHDTKLYGAQLSLLALLKNIDRRKYNPIVVTPNDGPLIDEINKLNIHVYIRQMVHWVASGTQAKTSWPLRATLFLKNLRTRVWAISALIIKHDIHLVYTNTVTCIEGALAAHISNRPHIWHLREQAVGNSQLRAIVPSFLLKNIIYALSSRIIVNSRHLSKFYRLRYLPEKISIVHNGIDVSQFSTNRANRRIELISMLSIQKECKIVTTIAAIIPRKGINLLIDAASILSAKDHNIVFLIVGAGDEEYVQLLMQQAKDLNIHNRILFLGHRTDIPLILGGTDVLSITAEDEAFGRTAIEAMAAHVPVVATRCGGPEEVIIDGVTGFLAQNRTPSCVADAIENILINPAIAESFATAGYIRAQEHFSVFAYTQKIESVFNKITYNI